MRIEDHFTAGQKRTLGIEGTYVYVERSPGLVQVVTSNGYVYDLPPRGQFMLPDGEQFDQLNVTNSTREAGEIELSVGFGRYIPSSSGQVVTVDNVLGPVRISEMPQLDVALPNRINTAEQPQMGMSTPAHITLNPLEKKRIAITDDTRKELIIQQVSASKTVVMLGDSNISAVSGLPCIGSLEQGGGTVLSGGYEVWAFNSSTDTAKLATMEVML